jgi:hypothetical protein
MLQSNLLFHAFLLLVTNFVALVHCRKWDLTLQCDRGTTRLHARKASSSRVRLDVSGKRKNTNPTSKTRNTTYLGFIVSCMKRDTGLDGRTRDSSATLCHTKRNWSETS